MAGEGSYALAPPPVPYLDRVVHAPSDEFDVVELESANSPGVAFEAMEFLTSLEVPDAGSAVVRSSDEDGEGRGSEGFVEL